MKIFTQKLFNKDDILRSLLGKEDEKNLSYLEAIDGFITKLFRESTDWSIDPIHDNIHIFQTTVVLSYLMSCDRTEINNAYYKAHLLATTLHDISLFKGFNKKEHHVASRFLLDNLIKADRLKGTIFETLSKKHLGLALDLIEEHRLSPNTTKDYLRIADKILLLHPGHCLQRVLTSVDAKNIDREKMHNSLMNHRDKKLISRRILGCPILQKTYKEIFKERNEFLIDDDSLMTLNTPFNRVQEIYGNRENYSALVDVTLNKFIKKEKECDKL